MSTTRRGILGILAATPIAAVAVAKAVTTKAPYAFQGVIGESWSSTLVGEDCGGFVLSPAQSIAFRKILDAPATRSEPLTILMRSASPWDIPNRLAGTYINEDGDAT